MTKQSIYERITDTIVKAVESNPGKWQMPWHRGNDFGLPYNATTKKAYKGANVIVLWSRGYKSQEWATYKQWAAVGAQVRKGERGTACIKWVAPTDKDKSKKAKVKPNRMIPFGFTVFNAEQVDGWTPAQVVETVDLVTRLANVDRVIERAGAHIEYRGTAASYSPALDMIRIPPSELFKDTETSTATENFYSTSLHEHTHWTGHKSRLDRAIDNSFGTDAYAFEELVAELGAAFLCARLGITNDPRPDHAKYLAGWLRVMKGDARAIVRAASLAQKAADYIAPEEQEEVAEPELQRDAMTVVHEIAAQTREYHAQSRRLGIG